MNTRPTVLVICTGNSMRSQMAEGLLKHELGQWIDVYSAGTHPCYVHPSTIKALNDVGIDTSDLRSKSVNEFTDMDIDLVITVCDSAKENCPVLPGARNVAHRPYWDPYYMRPNDDPEEIFAELREKMRAELVPFVKQELGLDS